MSIADALHQVTCNSEDLDPGFCQGRVLTDRSACLVTPNHVLWITQGVGKRSDGSATAPVLRMVIHPINPEAGLGEVGAFLAQLICTLPAEQVQWDKHTAWLPIDGFREAVAAGQRPRVERITEQATPLAAAEKPSAGAGNRTLPKIEDTCDQLSARLDSIGMTARDVDASTTEQTEIHWDLPDPDIVEEVPQRLTAWAMALTVSVIALPVGTALILTTLLKGESVRLAAQTAAITGLFVGLNSAGATADTVQLITSIAL
ncbi:hypothetical protein [Roseovarius pelagicus]|uniref:Uncharacterized protein n=1 Tax=Roseovarius pelagicus TaxID=2980108 RepID=A0ABY6DG39_9RHOB|nr:hypothetical protein [Roseovarius pelagicus]UXX82760.1 hypothetical protein N7U68_16990 [Roseovarius pelagicus]